MKRILIVEDQAEIRELIRLTLELGDWDVHEAADGPSGLAAAQRLSPDIVLLDVMMPGGMDGLAVCERLPRGGSHVRHPVAGSVPVWVHAVALSPVGVPTK